MNFSLMKGVLIMKIIRNVLLIAMAAGGVIGGVIGLVVRGLGILPGVTIGLIAGPFLILLILIPIARVVVRGERPST